MPILDAGLRACLAALLLSLTALSGCQQAEQPLRVGTNIWVGYESLYLAQSKGYLDGSPIQLITMHNATEVKQSLREGTLEAATLTLDETLGLVQDGIDLEVVLVMDTSNGADVLMARPEIAALHDLKGKRVGVESTAVGALMLQAALDAAGLAPTDVEVVDMGIHEHFAAYREGRVDAVVTFEPVRSELLKVGARVLFDSSRIPGRVIDVLVTRPAVAQRHEAALKKLVAGHFRALGDLRDSPVEAAATMTRRQGMSAEEIVAAYEGLTIPDLAANRRYLAPGESPLRGSARSLARLMLDKGLLQRPVDVERLATDRFLPKH